MVRRTKQVHRVWREWQQIPEKIRKQLMMEKPIIGKWHYFYEANGKKIGLIKLNNSLTQRGHCWEACGSLEFERFKTKKEAEKAILDVLNYKKIEKLWNNIAKFEEGEIKTSVNAMPLQKEARAAARMEAYVKLMEREIEN